MDTPVFSVVVPTMGPTCPLKNCLAALASLPVPDAYEVVVVNDGGGPDTHRVISSARGPVAELGPRLKRRGQRRHATPASRVPEEGSFAFTDDDSEPDSDCLRALQDVRRGQPRLRSRREGGQRLVKSRRCPAARWSWKPRTRHLNRYSSVARASTPPSTSACRTPSSKPPRRRSSSAGKARLMVA